MGTRSTISIERHDGTVSTVYCHWDGYYEHNGKMLLEHYDTAAKVEALITMGDISSLDSTIEKCIFYMRDREETECEADEYDSFEKFSDSFGKYGKQEYNYLFSENVWLTRMYDDSEWTMLLEHVEKTI
jgi:hypothetical protein